MVYFRFHNHGPEYWKVRKRGPGYLKMCVPGARPLSLDVCKKCRSNDKTVKPDFTYTEECLLPEPSLKLRKLMPLLQSRLDAWPSLDRLDRSTSSSSKSEGFFRRILPSEFLLFSHRRCPLIVWNNIVTASQLSNKMHGWKMKFLSIFVYFVILLCLMFICLFLLIYAYMFNTWYIYVPCTRWGQTTKRILLSFH